MQDNHDAALDERLEIITTCFENNVNSVIMQFPDLEELYKYKRCIRKFARTKMRAVSYYHATLHSHEDYLLKNLHMMHFLMPNAAIQAQMQAATAAVNKVGTGNLFPFAK